MRRTLKYKSDNVSKTRFWLSIAAIVATLVAIQLLWPSGADAATQCYPASECGTSEPDNSTPYQGKPDPGALERNDSGWGSELSDWKCPASVVSGTVVGAGTGGWGGAAWGTAGGFASCGINAM